ncbi:MAG: hypothetical protein ACLSVD_13620 [Eggerthellaceae bacterium]
MQGYEARSRHRRRSQPYSARRRQLREGVMRNVGPLISAEIGWNIDSQDWRKPSRRHRQPGENAWPGAIVLMHDGGGDRSNGRGAQRRAPYLKSQATASSPWTSCRLSLS